MRNEVCTPYTVCDADFASVLLDLCGAYRDLKLIVAFKFRLDLNSFTNHSVD